MPKRHKLSNGIKHLMRQNALKIFSNDIMSKNNDKMHKHVYDIVVPKITTKCLNYEKVPKLRQNVQTEKKCLNCDKMSKLRKSALIATDCLNCEKVPKLRQNVLTQKKCLNCNRLSKLRKSL